jgi:hypothetical protein
MPNEDVRAKILQDLYYRRSHGMEILTRPADYSKLIGVTEDVIAFNIQYLAMAELVIARSIGSIGTTKKLWFILDISSRGIEAVEGKSREGLAVNFNIININAPVSDSQIAAGENIAQEQSLNTFQDIEHYIEHNLSGPVAKAIQSEVRELQEEIQNDQMKPSRTQKIRNMCKQYGPAALAVSDAIMRLVTAYLQSGQTAHQP